MQRGRELQESLKYTGTLPCSSHKQSQLVTLKLSIDAN